MTHPPPPLALPFTRRPAPGPVLPAPPDPPEEVLVADTRAGLTPSAMVERKLAALFNAPALAVSQQEAGVPRDHGRVPG